MKVSRESTIVINELKWTISEVESIVRDNPAKITMGTSECVTLHIDIMDGLPNDNFEKTLRHELAHAFLYSYGLDQVQLDDEVLCDFVSIYASKIVKLCDDYMKERGKKK